MAEDEYEGYVKSLREPIGISEAPGERCEGQEEGEEICERRVGAVVGFSCLFL